MNKASGYIEKYQHICICSALLCDKLKVMLLIERARHDKVKPLTMLMYKSQPRHHLKHDVPNFILWEHLILSDSTPNRQRRKEGWKRNKSEVLRKRKSVHFGCVEAWTLMPSMCVWSFIWTSCFSSGKNRIKTMPDYNNSSQMFCLLFFFFF